MPLSGVIFSGVTIGPIREHAARMAKASGATRFVTPCAGRFAMIEAMVKAGIPPGTIEASDITLFSSILGTLADPSRTLTDLEISVEDRYADFVGEGSDVERAAGLMVLIRYLQIPPTSAYTASHRRELRANLVSYRAAVVGQLDTFLSHVGGIRYAVQDVWEVVAEARDDPSAWFYCNPPGYGGGYARMFKGSEDVIAWAEPGVAESPPERIPEMYEVLGPGAARAVLYSLNGVASDSPGWQRVFAHTTAPGKRVDYLLANYSEVDIAASYPLRNPVPRVYEVYADQEITAESVISFVPVDRDTSLYYRDLFVHRLGATTSEVFYLMMIDGRVTTAVGLHTADLRRGATPFLYETFGISISSKRYKRLGKLFMMCLTSGDFKRQLLRDNHRSFTFREPTGIRTASPTLHHEGKTDRSVMRLIKREPRPEGGFQLVYEGDFRDDAWPDCLAEWLTRWGEVTRGGEAAVKVGKKKRAMAQRTSPPVLTGGEG